MKLFLKTAICAGVLAMASAAQASVIPVSLFKPGGAPQIVSNITDIDYNSNGAAVVIGAGPFGSPGLSVGQVYTNLFQTDVIGFNRGPLAVGSGDIAAGLNDAFASGGYEITAVARLTEVVVAASANSATFVTVGGTVSLFYDDTGAGGTKSNLAAGTGYDDGREIYRGQIISGGSLFGVLGNLGFGSTNVTARTLLLDATVIQGLPGDLLSFYLNAEGQIGFPPGNADTNNYHIGGSALFPNYVVDQCVAGDTFGQCDLKLRFDGSSRFETPEPGTVALLGLALLAAGAGVRRKLGA